MYINYFLRNQEEQPMGGAPPLLRTLARRLPVGIRKTSGSVI